jgi:hypothetical protein
MIIHGQTIDPTTITRLRIVHAHGELDLGGAHAVEALRAIRRVQTTGGKAGKPATVRPAILAALADGEARTIAELVALTGSSKNVVWREASALVEAGELAEGESRRSTRGAWGKTYRRAS